jgi:hypothetical protein
VAAAAAATAATAVGNSTHLNNSYTPIECMQSTRGGWGCTLITIVFVLRTRSENRNSNSNLQTLN